MKKTLLAALVAVLAVAVLGFGAATESKQTEGKTFSERLKESSAAHYWIAARKYDEALKALPYVGDIDAIEPVTGLTALCMAAQNETADAYDLVVPLVSLYRANVDAADRNGLTPLHYAAQAGNLSVVEYLVNQGADVDAVPNIEGCGENCPPLTPLRFAYQKGRTRVAKFLESRGAEPLDAKTRSDLDVQAKVKEALAAMYDTRPRRPPPGVSKQEWTHQRRNASFDQIIDTLRDAGRVEEMARVEAMRRPILDALENTPRGPGMDVGAWSQLIIRTAYANAANQQQ